MCTTVKHTYLIIHSLIPGKPKLFVVNNKVRTTKSSCVNTSIMVWSWGTPGKDMGPVEVLWDVDGEYPAVGRQTDACENITSPSHCVQGR